MPILEKFAIEKIKIQIAKILTPNVFKKKGVKIKKLKGCNNLEKKTFLFVN